MKAYTPEDLSLNQVIGSEIIVNGVMNYVLSISYDADEQINTFTLLNDLQPEVVGIGSLSWNILVPAENTFPGSYFVHSATQESSTVHNLPVILWGPGLSDIFNQYIMTMVKAANIVLDVHTVSMISTGVRNISVEEDPQAIKSISISPLTWTLAKRDTEDFIATGHRNDGSVIDLTAVARWSAVPNWIASVDTEGTVTGHAVGSAMVVATYKGISSAARLTVT